MASPITWQNVNGRSLAEAAVPLESASKLILGGFDRLSNTADGYGKLQQTIQNQEEEANVQNFMERLQRARTPKEVDELQASGELDTLRAALKPASLAKVRGAEDARIASLMQQTTARNTFDIAQRDLTEAPIRDQIAVLTAQGKHKEAADLMATSGIRNVAPLAQADTLASRATTQFNNQQSAEARAAAAHEVTLATNKLQLTKAEQEAADADVMRKLDAQLGKAGAEHQATVAKNRILINAAAKELKLPTDSEGNLKTLDSKQTALLDSYLKVNNLPPLASIQTADTSAAARYIEDLRASGKYTASQLATVESKLGSVFSTVPIADIGNTAAASAKKDVMQEALDKENRMRYGILSTPENIAELRDASRPLLANLAKTDSWRGESYRRQLATFLDKGGIPTGEKDSNGNQIRVLPSPEQLANLIDTVNTSYGFLGMTGLYGDDVSKVLEAWAKTPEAISGAKELLRSAENRTARDVLKASLKKKPNQ